MPGCPHSPEDCSCVEHHAGLMAYSPDPVAYAKALERIRPTVLRVVTMGPERDPDCDGSLRCVCKNCTAERVELVRRGGKGSGARQPWDPRPSRRAA